MLQTHMKIVRPNRTATVPYKVDSNEVNTNSKVNILDNKATNVQSIKMTMRNVLVDSNCRLIVVLNGKRKMDPSREVWFHVLWVDSLA